MGSILESIAALQRELGEPLTEDPDSPVVLWADLVLRVALRRGAGTIHLIPRDGDLRVLLDQDELPLATWTGSALSRFLVICGLEKGEPPRSSQQHSKRQILVGDRKVEILAQTVPLRAWREEIHLSLRLL